MENQQVVYGSERIDQLPLPQKPLNPTEYARLMSVLPTQENFKTNFDTKHLKHYFAVGILFALMSFAFVDRMLLLLFPALQGFSYLIVILKTLLFLVLLYIIESLKL
jgi:hypothetical protein